MARTVRLSDPSWSTADDYVLQRLMDRVQVLISSQCNGMHIEDVSNFLDRHDPRIRTDPHHHAYLLYGPRVVFAEDGQLKVEVRGLVYEPMAALVGNALVLELGDDGGRDTFAAPNTGAHWMRPQQKGHAPSNASDRAGSGEWCGALQCTFENARRDAVSLWLLKWQLWKAGQEKFYKTSRELKAIDRLCWWVPNTVTR